MHYRPSKLRTGPIVELSYPQGTLQALSEVLDADWRIPIDSVLQRTRTKLEAKKAQDDAEASFVHYLDADLRERMALTLAWERGTGRRVPHGHVIVLLDGKQFDPKTSDLQLENLYCLPRHELIRWLGFVRTPIDVHVAQLERSVMHLKTSDDVKTTLLGVLAQLVDPKKPLDLVRQRAICETVQTLVGVLKADIAYIRAVDGDGVLPFFEPARREAQKHREAAGRRPPLLSGPSASHPWRGLGGRDKG